MHQSYKDDPEQPCFGSQDVYGLEKTVMQVSSYQAKIFAIWQTWLKV